MIGYLLEFCVIICIILPIYLLLRRPWRREHKREVALGAFVIFMIGVMFLALQGEYQAPARMLKDAGERLRAGVGINYVPFRSIRSYFMHYSLDGFMVNFVGNIVLFMPWGLGLTLLWKRFQSVHAVIMTSAGLTLFIETVQLFIGRSVDVDDLILNFLGSCAGAIVCLVLRRKFRALLELAR